MLHDMTEENSHRGYGTAANTGTFRVITEAKAARILTNPVALRFLTPFLGRETTIQEAAAEAGASPNTTYKRAMRFLELGLIEVTREQPRAGRAVKLYRTVADVLFVPFENTPSVSLEAALKEREEYWANLLRANVVHARSEVLGTWGTRIYRDHRGRLQVQTALTPESNATTLAPDAPAVLSAWRDNLMLDFADAKALQHELFNVLLKYQRKSGAQRYIIHVGLAPLVYTEV